MREDIEKIISEELDQLPPSLGDLYEPIEEEIQEKVDRQNKKLESELVQVIESNVNNHDQ